VKSLLAFGQRTGYLVLNVGAAVKLQQSKDTLAERMLSEADVHAMLALEPGRRNQVLLRLLYRRRSAQPKHGRRAGDRAVRSGWVGRALRSNGSREARR
jgi:hypothetical protein